MESSPFVFILYGIFAFFALIAIGLSYLIYRFIRKKTKRKWLQLFALIPMLIFVFLVYRAYVPGDSFYEGHFTSVTGLEFPNDGEILYGQVSNVDEFGDGTYTSVSHVGSDVLEKIPAILIEKGYTELPIPNEYAINGDYTHITREFSLNERGKNINVGFLVNGEALLIRISLW